jgi:hypothetical protein
MRFSLRRYAVNVRWIYRQWQYGRVYKAHARRERSLRMERTRSTQTHIDDFDEDTNQGNLVWKTEYDTMKVAGSFTIKKMMRGEPIAENNESTYPRPRVSWTTGLFAITGNSLAWSRLVLDRQDHNLTMARFDWRRLAEIYKACGSSLPRESAQTWASGTKKLWKISPVRFLNPAK